MLLNVGQTEHRICLKDCFDIQSNEVEKITHQWTCAIFVSHNKHGTLEHNRDGRKPTCVPGLLQVNKFAKMLARDKAGKTTFKLLHECIHNYNAYTTTTFKFLHKCIHNYQNLCPSSTHASGHFFSKLFSCQFQHTQKNF